MDLLHTQWWAGNVFTSNNDFKAALVVILDWSRSIGCWTSSNLWYLDIATIGIDPSKECNIICLGPKSWSSQDQAFSTQSTNRYHPTLCLLTHILYTHTAKRISHKTGYLLFIIIVCFVFGFGSGRQCVFVWIPTFDLCLNGIEYLINLNLKFLHLFICILCMTYS